MLIKAKLGRLGQTSLPLTAPNMKWVRLGKLLRSLLVIGLSVILTLGAYFNRCTGGDSPWCSIARMANYTGASWAAVVPPHPAMSLQARDSNANDTRGSNNETEVTRVVAGGISNTLEVNRKAAVQKKVKHHHTANGHKAKMAQLPQKPVRMTEVDCKRLFAGNRQEKQRAYHLQKANALTTLTPKDISASASNCQAFKENYSFVTNPLTREERDFPIAYSLLVFRDADQVLNLLRSIYRPQNYYCLHVDLKAKAEFREAMVAIARCFPNVFLSSRSVRVHWGTYTVLEPEIICMGDLWRYKKWKYFFNLTGQEFPLRTNWELVSILKAYKGANNVGATRRRMERHRFRKAGRPPAGIKLTKGSVHITVNRDFVDYVLHTWTARRFLAWSRRAFIPDEVFFASLNHNPHLGIKGSYTGEPETHWKKYPFMTRYKNWGSLPCAGKWVRQICIMTIGDLPFLNKRRELFANKFHAGYSKIALGCLAERIFNNTRDELLGRRTFDASPYGRMSFVRRRLRHSTFKRIRKARRSIRQSQDPRDCKENCDKANR